MKETFSLGRVLRFALTPVGVIFLFLACMDKDCRYLWMPGIGALLVVFLSIDWNEPPAKESCAPTRTEEKKKEFIFVAGHYLGQLISRLLR